MKALLITFLISLTTCSSLLGQPRANYTMLHRMNQAPSTFMSQVFFPTESEITETVFLFKIGYDQLTFLRNQGEDGEIYTSDIELTIDIYDKDTAEIPDRAFIERRTWASKVVSDSYENTQSSEMFVEGFLSFDLNPDRYRFIATINVNGQSRLFSTPGNQSSIQGMLSATNRRNNQRNAGLRQFVQVPNLSSDTPFSTIAFIAKSSSDSLILFNSGSNVAYSEDYTVLIGINTTNVNTHTLEVLNLGNRLNRNVNTDSTAYQVVFSKVLDQSSAKSTGSGLFLANGDEVSQLDQPGIEYHIISVPNSKFPNSWYQIRVVDTSSNEKTLASSIVLSRWFDIPSSLLNLDIALENMRFIVDENQLKELRRGNAAEKEQKFRTFWKQRDPTPDTEYNELMTEYYRRIDQAYDQFTTPSKAGHESDQGKIFIVYGPPENIERRFPPNGNTQEVWTYADRTFIFTATSGFGDFQLATQ